MVTKEEILQVIEKHLIQSVDEVSEGDMNPENKLTEYGASSLDIVEIVSGSMRELRIRIPRPELSNIENINDLAEKFLEYAQPEE